MTIDNVLITVVIPCYNRSQFIVRTLESVAAQSYRPIEIIVVDDGSQDDTVNTVNHWARVNTGPDLSLSLHEQQHLGGNAARNAGIIAARGEFIAFLDSDDAWLPDKLALQLQALITEDDAGGVYCGLREIDLDTGLELSESKRRHPQGDILKNMLIQDVTEPTSCWMVRRSAFEKAGLFDTELPARQDWDMWIRLCAHYPVVCVDKELVEMGNHSGERVRSKAEREIEAHKIIFHKYRALRRQYPFWISLAARSAMYRRRGRVYFHRGISIPRALGMQVLAIACWPFAFDSYAALLGIMLPATLRAKLRVGWNRAFGNTVFAIKTH